MMPDVQRDERRARVAREDAVAGGEQLGERREVAPVERPVRMGVQLLEPLVEAIDRQEERLRIRDVDGDGHVEGRARLPHRVEPRVVDPRRAVRRCRARGGRGRASSAPSGRGRRPRAPSRSSSAWSLRVARAPPHARTSGSVNVRKRPGCAVWNSRTLVARPAPVPPVRLTIVRRLRRSITGSSSDAGASTRDGVAARNTARRASRNVRCVWMSMTGYRARGTDVSGTRSMLRGWNCAMSSGCGVEAFWPLQPASACRLRIPYGDHRAGRKRGGHAANPLPPAPARSDSIRCRMPVLPLPASPRPQPSTGRHRLLATTNPIRRPAAEQCACMQVAVPRWTGTRGRVAASEASRRAQA